MRSVEVLCYTRGRLSLLLATWRSSSIRLGIPVAAWRAHCPAELDWKSSSQECPGLGSAPGAGGEGCCNSVAVKPKRMIWPVAVLALSPTGMPYRSPRPQNYLNGANPGFSELSLFCSFPYLLPHLLLLLQ